MTGAIVLTIAPPAWIIPVTFAYNMRTQGLVRDELAGLVAALIRGGLRNVAELPLISIVDDDDGVRSSLDGLMRSLGYKVALFESAERFLASDAAANSECVVSDVQMPGGMSGLDLLASMRNADSHIPVILISAFTGAEAREDAVRAGAFCTLKKPFDGDDLAHCIERALSEGV